MGERGVFHEEIREAGKSQVIRVTPGKDCGFTAKDNEGFQEGDVICCIFKRFFSLLGREQIAVRQEDEDRKPGYFSSLDQR